MSYYYLSQIILKKGLIYFSCRGCGVLRSVTSVLLIDGELNPLAQGLGLSIVGLTLSMVGWRA